MTGGMLPCFAYRELAYSATHSKAKLALATGEGRVIPSTHGRVKPPAPLRLYKELNVLSILSRDEEVIGGTAT